MRNFNARELEFLAVRGVDAHKIHLDRYGYCIIPDVLAMPRLAEVATRLKEQAAAEKAQGLTVRDAAQLDGRTQYVYSLVNKGDEFVELVIDLQVLALVEYVLGPNFLLSASDGVIAHPDSTMMPLHTDQWWMPPPVPRGTRHSPVGKVKRFVRGGDDTEPSHIAPPVVCSVMWMISPFTEENGATRVVPGSHLYGRVPEPTIPHQVPSIAATGTAGSVLIFDGRIWHCTGANQTRKARHGILNTYCGPQFRQMENYPVGASESLLDRSNPLLRRLLGLQIWEGYGKVDATTKPFIDRRRAPVGRLTNTRKRK